MNKRIDTLILIVIAAAVVVLIALSYKTCQVIKEQKASEMHELEDEDTEANEVFIGDLDSEDEDINPGKIQTTFTPVEAEVTEQEIAVESKQTPTQKGDTPPVVDEKVYLVLAGSFSKKENAETSVKALRKNGYEAEVVTFVNSDYFSVCAGKFTTRGAADDLVQSLSDAGIKSYVHQRRD